MNNIDNYCNNCGKYGHLYHQCKTPITSFGIIVFRIKDDIPQYLMIRRKDTLGYIDFMRGKYSIYNKYYIMNMLMQMTVEEKNKLLENDFDSLWLELWGTSSSVLNQYKSEESISRDKFQLLNNGIFNKNIFYTLQTMIEESNNYDPWEEPEWGFPKGRRNFQEKDLDCAIREFEEETGISKKDLTIIENIVPFEEIFIGSNHKSYKHKYFLAYMDTKEEKKNVSLYNYQQTEVSKIEWKSLEECLESIRPYNLEKKQLIININKVLKEYRLY
jgi:8-oxo-dGTP pyrophosphatase MutT (NUDIX family)